MPSPSLARTTLLLTTVLSLAACPGASPPATVTPGEAASPEPEGGATAEADPATPTEPDPNGPPMYKPSSKSPAPMALTDPAYGAYPAAPEAPTLGDTIPDFEVALADGGTWKLAEARAAGPVLIMFYRGYW